MSEEYVGPERRESGYVWLSEEQMEQIASRAAKRALENFYLEVGKVTIRTALYVLGALVLSGLAYLGLYKEIRLP